MQYHSRIIFEYDLSWAIVVEVRRFFRSPVKLQNGACRSVAPSQRFDNDTNNRTESENGKLNSLNVVSSSANLAQYIKNVYVTLETCRIIECILFFIAEQEGGQNFGCGV